VSHVAPGTDTEGRAIPRLGYVPAMDGLRGTMLLVIIAVHALFIVRPDGSLLPGGFIALDVFLVQSGFLITALLLSERGRTGEISFRNFYLRRACRLLPAVTVMLAFHAAYWISQGKPIGVEVRAIAAIGLYVSNIFLSFPGFLGVTMPNEFGHMWSLSMEEQFYILWPLALALILRVHDRRRRSVPTALWVGIVAVAVIRIVVFRTQGYPAAYELLWAHADGILMGCALAFLWRDGRLPRRGIVPLAWLSLAAMAWFALFFPRFDTWPYYWGFTLQGILSAILVAAVMGQDWSLNRFFASRPMAALGKTSYAAYLWHLPLIQITHDEMADSPSAVVIMVALALTAAATTLSWYLVEQPFLRLKARRFGSQAHGVPGAAPSVPPPVAIEGAT